LDGGAAWVTIAALKAIGQSNDPQIDPNQFNRWVRNLLMAINLIKIPHSQTEMIDLLSASDRLDKQVLSIILREDGPILAERQWTRNVNAVILTIRRVEGAYSMLLQEMLESDWCTSEIRDSILGARGV
jgi:hypothetical protein